MLTLHTHKFFRSRSLSSLNERLSDVIKNLNTRPFSTYRTKNEDVELNHTVNVNSPDLKYMMFIHGLFGSMNNWRTISRSPKIAEKRNTILLDVRNHGNSDHHDQIEYNVMSDDIIRLADKLKIDKFTILGHSMGGKISMTLACRYPDRIDGVVSVDSAPSDYNKDVQYISYVVDVVDKVKHMDIQGYEKRDLLQYFTEQFRSVAHAQLLLMNTKFDKNQK